MTREEEIKRNMKLLDISREEAEQLYEDDHNDVVTPEMAKMEAKAKKIKRYEKSDTPKKKAVKERKVDEEKGKVLQSYKVLTEGMGGTVTEVKNEAEFSFLLNGNSYTVKLVKHRPKK